MSNIFREIYERAGIRHEGEMRSELNQSWRRNLEDIDARFREGKITRDQGLAATRRLMELELEEMSGEGNFESYLAARKSGMLDQARQAIRGWKDDQSDEAAARERADSLNLVLAQRTQEMHEAGALPNDEYVWAMEKVAPGIVAEATAAQAEPQPEPEHAGDYSNEEMDRFCRERARETGHSDDN